MSATNSAPAVKPKRSVADVFVEGAVQGWNIGVKSTIPNVVMAYAVIAVLKLTGALDFISLIFDPVMGLFSLPGVAIAVLVGAWLSMGGGVGIAASLATAGMLSNEDVTILLPAIFLMGAQLQYWGRVLGTSGVQAKFYPMYFGISIMNALLCMFLLQFFV